VTVRSLAKGFAWSEIRSQQKGVALDEEYEPRTLFRIREVEQDGNANGNSKSFLQASTTMVTTSTGLTPKASEEPRVSKRIYLENVREIVPTPEKRKERKKEK
jgi:hypothetical protein